MHIGLFTRCITSDDLAKLNAAVSRWPDLVLSVALSGRIVDELADSDELAPLAGSQIDWIRSARTAPSLGHLPDRFVRTALAAENEAMDDLGLTGNTVYFKGAPGERLPRIVQEVDMTALITTTPTARSGLLIHLDALTPCFGAGVDHEPGEAGDNLTIWQTNTAQLEADVEAVMAMPGCDLTTPTRFLETHQVGGVFHSEDLGSTPDLLLARKLVRLSTRLPARPASEVTNLLLDAAAVDALDVAAGHDSHRQVQEALIAARTRIDESRRRNDDWARVSRLDWDADGREDIQVELANVSCVIDARRNGRILVLDDKASGTPIGWLPDELPALIARSTSIEGVEKPMSLAVTQIDERRDGVAVGFDSPDQEMTASVTVGDRSFEMGYSFTDAEPIRFGPEFPFSIGKTELRVDGGEWMSIIEATAVMGHRFRLRGQDREILISALLPTHLFIRPSGDRGVVAWSNWLVGGTADYSLRIDLNA